MYAGGSASLLNMCMPFARVARHVPWPQEEKRAQRQAKAKKAREEFMAKLAAQKAAKELAQREESEQDAAEEPEACAEAPEACAEEGPVDAAAAETGDADADAAGDDGHQAKAEQVVGDSGTDSEAESPSQPTRRPAAKRKRSVVCVCACPARALCAASVCRRGWGLGPPAGPAAGRS